MPVRPIALAIVCTSDSLKRKHSASAAFKPWLNTPVLICRTRDLYGCCEREFPPDVYKRIAPEALCFGFLHGRCFGQSHSVAVWPIALPSTQLGSRYLRYENSVLFLTKSPKMVFCCLIILYGNRAGALLPSGFQKILGPVVRTKLVLKSKSAFKIHNFLEVFNGL